MLVVSDTHWKETPSGTPFPLDDHEVVVHAGDHVSEATLELYEDVDLHAVRGNADEPEVEAVLPAETRFRVEDVAFGVVHGHRQRSEDQLRYLALDLDVDVLIHGHGHTPRYRDEGVALLEPGSPTSPRGGFPATYVEMEVKGRAVEAEFVEMDSGAVYSCFETDFTGDD